jgi:putative multicomponent Na+:H+ antiporter subunit B
MNDFIIIYAIVALLPLSAFMVVFQVNPYHALVIRGILGAVAAMVYAVLGAADVALTEALVGTMLAITLYAVAVRSSLVMRLGVIEDMAIETDENPDFGQLKKDLRRIFNKRYMRLEIVPYENKDDLEQALMEREIHATCVQLGLLPQDNSAEVASDSETQRYHTTTRVQRIYDIMQAELSSPTTSLALVKIPDSGEKH